MHGYGVACFTAKCRRRATAPLAFYILDVPSSPDPLRPATLRPTLLRHPRHGFLSLRITLFAFPAAGRATRRVESRALPYSSHPVRAYIDRALAPSPRIVRSRDARRVASPVPACFSARALSLPLAALSQRERILRITPCVFYQPRGEPHSLLTLTLTLTRARVRISGPL